MLTSDLIGKGLAGALALWIGVGAAHAFDPDAVFDKNEEPQTILRYGYTALKEGRVDDALGAFRYGAEKQDLAATWKLGRMLQLGEGVARDDASAFRIFIGIADRYVTQVPAPEDEPFVSHAIVSAGVYFLTGVPTAGQKPDVRAAEDHFYRAAALYGDAEAQFRLGWLLRSGRLGSPQGQAAARWLTLAARKGHAAAQSELGDMLFQGDGVRRNRVRGLYLMSKGSLSTRADSLRDRARAALAEATDAERSQLVGLLSEPERNRIYEYGLVLPGDGALSRRVSASD